MIKDRTLMERAAAGVYQVDEDERAALERSAGDVRLGRLASDDEVMELFARLHLPG
jgi:hypothetical protein